MNDLEFFLGDSITDRAIYAAAFVRYLEALSPGRTDYDADVLASEYAKKIVTRHRAAAAR